MSIEAQDSTRLLLITVIGCLMIAAGLYLLLSPRRGGSMAKFELFGLKFESSSAGVLVFLVGAVFVAIPLFVPEKDRPGAGARDIDPAETQPAPPKAPDADPQDQVGGSPPDGDQPVDLTQPAIEVEPNDRIGDALVLVPGQVMEGQIGNNQTDWFRVPISPGMTVGEVRIRRVDGSGVVQVTAFDSREQVIGSAQVSDSTQYLTPDGDPGDALFLRVTEGIGLSADYEILVELAGGN